MNGSRNFYQGGIQARWPENSMDNFFLVLSLFYSFQRGSNGFIAENYIFPRIQRGSNISRGGGGGGGGVQMLISIETYITCDFPGGSSPPIPLWIHTRRLLVIPLKHVTYWQWLTEQIMWILAYW